MAVTVQIVERAGTYARYFVLVDGKERHQVHRDVSKEVAKAKRKRISLQKILEEQEK
jgi:hypothetical protein